MQQQYEELCILRQAQRECSDMATEIQALHVCVEEQRRHLQAQSSKPKDPGVGIFSWMDVLSKQHQQREADLRAAYELQVQALQVLHQTSCSQVTYLTEQVATLNASLQEAQQAAATSSKDLDMAYRCITEQRRHIHSVMTDGTSADTDVGLVPLVRAGVVQWQPQEAEVAALANVAEAQVDNMDMVVGVPVEDLSRAHMCFVLAVHAVDEELATARQQVKDAQNEREGVQAELSTCRHQVADLLKDVASAKSSMDHALCENVTLAAQVCMLQEAVASLQAAHTSVEELERVQRGFETLAEANEKLQLDVERLTKERDATIKGIRHWQAEAQKITTDLVSALESRDRFQAEQFTALKQCRQLTARVTELERQVADMFKFHQLGQQVFGLVQVVDGARVTESTPLTGASADGENGAVAVASTPAGNDGKKKAARGRRKKN